MHQILQPCVTKAIGVLLLLLLEIFSSVQLRVNQVTENKQNVYRLSTLVRGISGSR